MSRSISARAAVFLQGSLLRLPIRILRLQGGRVQALAVGEEFEPALWFADDLCDSELAQLQ